MAPGDTGPESGFIIDGKTYEVPSLDSFDMGERRVMYDYSGIVQEDFVKEDNEADEDHAARVAGLIRHPGFMQTLMHIAYQRGNPGVKRDKVAAVIEQTNYLDAVASLADDEPEDDAGPPDLSERTRGPDASSPSGSSGNDDSTKPKSATGGDGSTNGSDAPAKTPASTGTGRSGTSSPQSALTDVTG